MIHLRVRTEYSFRRAIGRVPDVLARADGTAMAITDSGTWGHVAFYKAAKAAGINPILGAEILVVPQPWERKKQMGSVMALLARDNHGLRELYELMTVANDAEHFYFVPRLSYGEINSVSRHLVVLSGFDADVKKLKPRPNVYLEYSPGAHTWNRYIQRLRGWNRVVTANNVYPAADDRQAYEIIIWQPGKARTSTSLLHIANEWELRAEIPEAEADAYLNTERIAAECSVELPQARMVQVNSRQSLRQRCLVGAKRRKLKLTPAYQSRLKHELEMIESKDFTDYFFVLADMINEAKKKMFVGPARGSSAGSLVCFLLGITDVDPLVHDLMFERFIDVTRADLPDVDVDFPDEQRQMVIDQLVQRYGAERVGRLGTINRYAPKSAIDDVARQLRIPMYELKDFKGAIIERSSGDARAQFAVKDALETLDIGKRMVEKYPGLLLAGSLEGAARHSGTHAAGLVVTEDALTNYCTIDNNGTAQIDKKDAEALNILKIDALGLRTLTVIEDCLAHVGKSHEWMREYPLDDEKAFAVFNSEQFAGIFQFEGYAVQSLCRNMRVRDFSDIAILTALARPGPLHSGSAADFVSRRLGHEPAVPLHPIVKHLTAETLGLVIYQEQVMSITREFGGLDWEDVNQLRRAMSKSLGDEFFNRYWERFAKGARKIHKIKEADARVVWDRVCTFGSWAFNKSHAVSYGLVAYWCAVLKAHWPLEYAAACLRHPSHEDHARRILRELVNAGYKMRPVDAKRSGLNWSVTPDGELLGGLLNIKGIGPKKAADIISRRLHGEAFPPGMARLMASPVTPYDDLFEGERRFGHIARDPKAHGIKTGPVTPVEQIQEAGTYIIIAKIVEKDLRDKNEYNELVHRGGRRIEPPYNLYLNLTLEDDSGSIKAQVPAGRYVRLGKPIVEESKIGDWYIWKGTVRDNWRKLYLTAVRRLENGE